MTRSRPPRLSRRLAKVLAASPLPVTYENGSRHLRIMIDGHQVLVINRGSRGRGDITSDQHDAAHVRRFLQRHV